MKRLEILHQTEPPEGESIVRIGFRRLSPDTFRFFLGNKSGGQAPGAAVLFELSATKGLMLWSAIDKDCGIPLDPSNQRLQVCDCEGNLQKVSLGRGSG
jgi:hypothetical protein